MTTSSDIPEYYQHPMSADQLRERIAQAKAEQRAVAAKQPIADKLRSLDQMHSMAKIFRASKPVAK